MANYTTKGAVTWSDEEGFNAQSIIDFYNQIQANKRADSQERRAEDRLEMARDEIASIKEKEAKMVQSQRYLNQAIMAHNKSGWNEEGTYTGSPGNTGTTIESYLGNMRDIGQAGDAWTVSNALGTVKAKNLQDDINILNNKASMWAANNQHRKGWFGDFEEAQKEYLKKIGADKLFADYSGIAGKEKASMAMPQFTPESLGTDDSWGWKEYLGGGVATGVTLGIGARGTKILRNAISKFGSNPAEATKDLKRLSNMEDAVKPIYNKIVSLREAGKTKEAERILKRFKDRLPELAPKISKEAPKTASGILSKVKKLGKGYLGFEAGSKFAESLGGGELTQFGSGIATPALAKKLMKPSNMKKLIPVISKVSPKLAQKLTLSMAGTLLPEGISTVVGIGGIMLMLDDIIELTSNPEVANVINSLE